MIDNIVDQDAEKKCIDIHKKLMEVIGENITKYNSEIGFGIFMTSICYTLAAMFKSMDFNEKEAKLFLKFICNTSIDMLNDKKLKSSTYVYRNNEKINYCHNNPINKQ